MNTNWETKRLGEIAQVKGGKRVPKGQKLQAEPTDHPYITVSDFTDAGTIDTSALRYVSNEIFASIARYTISTDDLYVSIAGTIGRTGYVPAELNGASLTENACKLVLNAGVCRDFVYYFTKSDAFLLQAGSNTRVAAQPKLALERLKTITLAVPPLPEQHRIVRLLDEAFGAIATAKANAEKNLQNARALFESHLQSVFSRCDMVGSRKPLGAIAEFRNGANFTKESKGELVKIVGVKDFQRNYWAPSQNLDTATVDGELSEPDTLRRGDILVVRSNGNIELIGRSVLVGQISEKTTHSGFTIRIRLSTSEVIPEYLCHLLKSPRSRKQLVEGGTGTNIKSLNQQTLAALKVAIPPAPAQRALVANLESVAEETQHLESLYRRKLAALDELKKSLLHQAFSGNL